MCGIFGYISTTSTLSESELAILTNTLKHRGPDAAGIKRFINGGVAFGHRRLSILDLSDAANQPMMSNDGRYCLTFNGEIYNFREIREELARNHRIQFRTDGDSEVILESFAIWGIDFLHKLNGMFAFSIYDVQEQVVWLVRDRIGIKPIYYQFKEDSTFIFGSELKSITSLPQFKGELDHEAVSDFLHLGYIPAPRSIWKGIRKFPQGTYMRMKLGEKPEFVPYWVLTEKVTPLQYSDETKAKAKLIELVESSVRLRLVSDVPVGTFLSGGIDSSLITAVAAKLKNEAVHTFTIGFREAKFDESTYARKVAAHLKTDHTSFSISEKEAQAFLLDMVDVFDEPFADSSAIPTMLVSKLAREKVTVILTGDGGDEQFLGYGSYEWAERLSHPFIYFFRNGIANILKLGNSRQKRAAAVFEIPGKSHFHDHIFSQEQYLFSDKEVSTFLTQPFSTPILFPELGRKLSPSERQAFFDLQYYLPDDLLVKVDRASMRYGLECRVPLLDFRLMEFSLNLEQDLKRRGKTTKYLLKEVLYEYVPRPLFERPKWGFAVPLGAWLLGDLRHLIDDFVNSSPLYDLRLVNREEVRRLVENFHGGKEYLYNRVWALLILHQWAKKNL